MPHSQTSRRRATLNRTGIPGPDAQPHRNPRGSPATHELRAEQPASPELSGEHRSRLGDWIWRNRARLQRYGEPSPEMHRHTPAPLQHHQSLPTSSPRQKRTNPLAKLLGPNCHGLTTYFSDADTRSGRHNLPVFSAATHDKSGFLAVAQDVPNVYRWPPVKSR